MKGSFDTPQLRAFMRGSGMRERSISSYCSNLRKVENVLDRALAGQTLTEPAIQEIGRKLLVSKIASTSANDCQSALRKLAAYRAHVGPGLDAVLADPLPTISVEPTRAIPERPWQALIDEAQPTELLHIYADVLAELRRRGLSRTGNGPIGDYAEHLFAAAFNWALCGNNVRGYAAVDVDQRRVQIKARRLGHPAASRQLSALRGLNDQNFDFLAAVLFNAECAVQRAVILPYMLVKEAARPVSWTNSWRLMLSDKLCDHPDARDVTAELRRQAAL